MNCYMWTNTHVYTLVLGHSQDKHAVPSQKWAFFISESSWSVPELLKDLGAEDEWQLETQINSYFIWCRNWHLKLGSPIFLYTQGQIIDGKMHSEAGLSEAYHSASERVLNLKEINKKVGKTYCISDFERSLSDWKKKKNPHGEKHGPGGSWMLTYLLGRLKDIVILHEKNNVKKKMPSHDQHFWSTLLDKYH